MRRPSRILIGIATALAVLAAACGGDDTANTPSVDAKLPPCPVGRVQVGARQDRGRALALLRGPHQCGVAGDRRVLQRKPGQGDGPPREPGRQLRGASSQLRTGDGSEEPAGHRRRRGHLDPVHDRQRHDPAGPVLYRRRPGQSRQARRSAAQREGRVQHRRSPVPVGLRRVDDRPLLQQERSRPPGSIRTSPRARWRRSALRPRS